MTLLSRRMVLASLGVAVLGLAGRSVAGPAAGRRYLVHVSGMT